ncbi:MAG: ABC transporter substrate-binding protein [Dehalococcoidia bacterium]
MKKVFLILLAMVLAISLGVVGCEPGDNGDEIPPQPDKIVVGMSKSETGPLADIHWAAAYPIVATMVPQINAAGGVLLKEYGATYKVPVETIIYDDGSDVGIMIENTVKLITVDEVDYLWGATGTAMISAQAPVANVYKKVLMTMEGGATFIKDDEIPFLPYLFVTLSFSDWYQLPVWADMLAEAGAETAFIAYIDDEHGLEYTEVATEEFARVGINITGTPFPMGYDFTAFDTVIAAAQTSGADVFCVFAYPPQNMPLLGEAIETPYNPNAIIFGPGANFGFFPFFAGYEPSDMEGVSCFAVANRATSAAMSDMFDAIEATMDGVLGPPPGFPGAWFLDWWGHPLYWAMVQIWQEAVEEVGYVSQDGLKDVLAASSPANPFTTILGPTWYTMFPPGGGILAYECHTGQIGQWQSEIVEIVGYDGVEDDLTNYVVTANFTYPKPAWPS